MAVLKDFQSNRKDMSNPRARSVDRYYAVRSGRTPGIYRTWEECKGQVDGFKGPVYKKFNNYNDAYDFVRGGTGPASAKPSAHVSPQEQIHSGVIEIYTDGACFNNGHPNAQAGIGVFFGDHNPRNISAPLPINLI